MPYKLKSNEEVTKAFDIEEVNFQLLKSNIEKTTHELREMQKEHKALTGKELFIF
jgi:hypothetical protein